ncbi:MAG: ABC transporter ATP-binding protein, partial [Allobranchiibius sp.]
MSTLTDNVIRRVARICGFPSGVGELVSASTRKRLIGSIFGSFLLSALDMIGVLAMLPMMQFIAGSDVNESALGYVNRALGDPSKSALVTTLAGMIVGAFVIKDIIAIGFRRWQLHFMAEQEAANSVQMLRGYLTGPYAWHLTRNTSDKIWTVGYAVGMGFSGGVTAALGLITEVLTIGLIFISLLFVSPLPTVFAAIYFGLAGVFLQRVIRRRAQSAGERSQVASQVASRTSLQSFGAAKEIKLRRAHEQFVSQYAQGEYVGAHARASAVLLGEIPKYLLEIVFVTGIGLLAWAATALDTGQSALVVLGVFVAAGSRILPSTVRLIAAVSGIRFAKAPLGHLVQENRAMNKAVSEENEFVVTDRVPRGDLAVRNLSFAYSDRPEDAVLRGVNLDVPAGHSVAIVGSSGAGKSTLVDILLGLHRPTDGRVDAGGLSIFDNLPGWQRRLAVVPQDVYLLDDSLRSNIIFDMELDEEKLARVVRRAQLHDLISALPDGLDTEVGERGARMSGGQRQRIGIARALYRSPEVLFLDEATSALDNDTERKLTDTIEDLKGSMTMIIVAHRLSTVRHCDQLIFMSQGRVATTGTFDDVVRDNAEFAHLVHLGSLGST